MIEIGSIVTVDLSKSSDIFRSIIQYHHFGIVNYWRIDDDGHKVANVSWFSENCNYSTWWDTNSLIEIVDSVDHINETLAGDFDWLVKAVEDYNATNPI